MDDTTVQDGSAQGAARHAAPGDTAARNAAVWQSDTGIADWVATADERERGREWARRLLAELLSFPAHESFTFVDIGAGTGTASRAVLDRYPAARAVLADYSLQMMAEGRRVLAPYEGRFRYVEIDLAAGRWPEELDGGLDAVISSLCVHHLTDDRKRGLFGEIFARLAPGAWYLNYDPIAAPDAEVEAAWQRVQDRRDPGAAARRAHRTPAEQERWENHVRHIAPLGPQLDALRAAGFEAVDAYWKELDHAIFGGRRPAS